MKRKRLLIIIIGGLGLCVIAVHNYMSEESRFDDLSRIRAEIWNANEAYGAQPTTDTMTAILMDHPSLYVRAEEGKTEFWHVGLDGQTNDGMRVTSQGTRDYIRRGKIPTGDFGPYEAQ